jgi:diadenosine tetraphosphate (Ap4A) HIT family hydrolase
MELQEKYSPDGFNIGINGGAAAVQVINPGDGG